MRRSKVIVFVHIVWGTWDRMRTLEGEVKRVVYRAIGAKCYQLGADIIALGGVEDHIHLLTQLPATLAIADLVKHVKGNSSHFVTQELRPQQMFRWQGAYGAFSVSESELPSVREYIKHQPEHHASGTTIPEWEDVCEIGAK